MEVTLKNPRIVPSQLVLQGTAAVDNLQFYMNDADGIASQIAAFTGDEFTTQGVVNLASVKEFLKSYALIIGGFNFYASSPAALSNNLTLVRVAIDGNSATEQIFSASSVSNMQNDPNLLNVNVPFMIDNATALKIAVPSNVGYVLTFKILAAVPYGQLDSFLSTYKIQVGATDCKCA